MDGPSLKGSAFQGVSTPDSLSLIEPFSVSLSWRRIIALSFENRYQPPVAQGKLKQKHLNPVDK